MERITIIIIMSLLLSTASFGQSAKEVLDKTASVVSNKTGVTATFTMKGKNLSTSGTIAVKGRKFHTTTPEATIWFDSKTMWTYVKKNEEVNVSSPSESELAGINPYNFINIYKKGYSYSLDKNSGSFIVTLKATDGKKSIQEAKLTVHRKTFVPSQILYKTSKGWMTVDIKDFKQAKLADGMFRFNPKDYPKAEVIDLR